MTPEQITELDRVLAPFQATGAETCFHGRHVQPQIYAGLDGSNWRLADYEARGGYWPCARASRKARARA